MILESTYGDRVHGSESIEQQLIKIVNETFAKGGTTLIPAFAVGRAQALLYALVKLKQTKKIPDLPIFLDSPMVIEATNIMEKWARDITACY